LKVTPVVGVVPPELVLRAKEVEGAELVVRRSVGTVNLYIRHDLPNEQYVVDSTLISCVPTPMSGSRLLNYL
jgi:hypothetical protein